MRHFASGPYGRAWPIAGGAANKRMLTENEAAKIGCPLLTLTFGLYQGSFTVGDGVCCQGSRCMMWRWQAKRLDGGERRGFCGLAGRPIER